jgi:hypothetical protein
MHRPLVPGSMSRFSWGEPFFKHVATHHERLLRGEASIERVCARLTGGIPTLPAGSPSQ